MSRKHPTYLSRLRCDQIGPLRLISTKAVQVRSEICHTKSIVLLPAFWDLGSSGMLCLSNDTETELAMGETSWTAMALHGS